LNEPAPDRRPIAARGLKVNIMLAEWLIARRASPNGISVGGMVAALLAGLVFTQAPAHPLLWLLGALLVQTRLMANLLDGMVAIGRNVASPLGEVFNEVPDRVSDTAVLLGIGIGCEHIALGLAASLAAMATAYIRVTGKSCGQRSDFCGPMAKQHRMAVVTAIAIWCAFAPEWLARPVPELALWFILALASLTAARRLHRLARALQMAQS